MRVIGTAGHVDHGKSTLVKRLTGINPDRLAEEKAREMTLDLGFAWMTLPDGETVGIVDVPGHRDFIDNMLAGVGGIDAVLLVIAADEGVMPQTREHLAILDLLGIANGLIVLSKTDLIDDDEWLELISGDIRAIVTGTSLTNAPIIPVSAHTAEGTETLLEELTHLLADVPPRPDTNSPRLAIDRIFTMSGFGTVVTGTLLGGSLRVGDEIEIQPTNLNGRVRGLQSYKQSVEVARPGSRVAVNLTGVDKHDLRRGDVLSLLGQMQPTRLIDVQFRHLPDAGRPLKHNSEVKLFTGAVQVSAHVRLLDDEVLPPDSEGWLQLRLSDPIAVSQHDRFILRYPSPAQTIGGGIIVDPHPARRWKRFQPQVIERLATRMRGTPAERIAQAANVTEPLNRAHLQQEVGYSDDELSAGLTEALAHGSIIELADGRYIATESYQRMLWQMIDDLTTFHREEPLRVGMSRESMRSRLGIKGNTLNLYLDMQDHIIAENGLLRLPDHEVRFTPEQHAAIESLWQHMNYTPPSYSEAVEAVSEPVLRALIEQGEVVQVQPEVIFSRTVYDDMVETTLAIIDADGAITAKALRDHFGTTRKYAIGLLEHLDALGVTRRDGDARVRGRRS